MDAALPGLNLSARAQALKKRPLPAMPTRGGQRTPYFCSGCPHNISTKVPEGSSALAGVGCHVMATWMDRNTESIVQMGGEGVNWVAKSLFNGGGHVFQNLGDGTFYHSGSLAVRQAVAAGTNITYKILFNDAVGMTGGQPVDGPLSVQGVAHSMRAEGVERIAVLSDDIGKFSLREFPPGTTLHDRAELDSVQLELRSRPGVTVLIYEQTCAAEKRRRRKRGQLPDPDRHVEINDLVCEGCGDCSVESNCLSVVPKETWLGRKRRIDHNSCNKDYSCLNGFCPAFVTVEGKRSRTTPDHAAIQARAQRLPPPKLPELKGPYNLLIVGVGGTGVVTLSQLVAMAAHLEGKGASALDFMGFAQKFGPVMSHVRLAPQPSCINQVRVERGFADALIACDLVAASSAPASAAYAKAHTRAVLNQAEAPTGEFVLHRDASLFSEERTAAIGKAVAELDALAASEVAERFLNDSLYANVLLLGFAWQKGLLPVSWPAIDRAFALNGVRVAENRAAFALGRIAAADAEFLADKGPTDAKPDLEARRMRHLQQYQNAAYAKRYRQFVDQVRRREAALGEGSSKGELAKAVAASYFKLLTYKDEYEVARLHLDAGFHRSLADRFEDGHRIIHHLAPPILSRAKDARGRPRKRPFGPWVRSAFRVLAKFRVLRGTVFDPFGHSADRRLERALVKEFEDAVQQMLALLSSDNLAVAIGLARLPLEVRGFGPVKQEAAQRFRSAVRTAIERLQGKTSAALH